MTTARTDPLGLAGAEGGGLLPDRGVRLPGRGEHLHVQAGPLPRPAQGASPRRGRLAGCQHLDAFAEVVGGEVGDPGELVLDG
ncbi:hypothetical protein F1D05_11305 [Kribbella qitaiheensis]|uniref:Uncharacterized protein n=1 Tax=Kribbella qitaiheensis TaxID=1544730 RepID=A0A7G6WWK9_9ACTN|nr:hypothetical protein [Kribbella qitaiheensis]QNE18374.1 hypothetical protein F1D05_11305 [Kribbella qitaiheensis]